jgi:putative peptidoglycan lipid II flippase
VTESEPPEQVSNRDAGSRRLLRSSAIVGLGTSASRITGYARVAAIAYALGGSALAGTYAYASQTPSMLYELLLGGVLTATLVPLFVRYVERRDEDAASAIFTISALALIVVTAIGVVIAPWIVHLFTLRVDGAERAAQQEVATTLLRLFMPMVLFYGMTALATALLHAHRKFTAAAIAPVLNNVVVIAVFLAIPRLYDGNELRLANAQHDTTLLLLLGIGTTAGVAAVAIVLVPALLHTRAHLRFLPAWRHHAVVTMARLSGWTIGYVIANQVALWFVLILANGENGGPFLYLSAYTFFQLPHGLLAVSLTTTLAPEMASAAGRGDLAALRERLAFGMRLIGVMILPAAAAYIGLARPIVVVLLQRGAFSAADAAVVADSIAAFSVGLVFFSIYLFALRAFYALPDTRTPFIINCFENAANVLFAIPLYLWLGIPGLALAFSAAYVVASIVTLDLLRHRIGGLGGRRTFDSLARCALAAVAVAVVTWAASAVIGWDGTGRALASTVVGLLAGTVVYVGGLALLRVPELGQLRDLLPGRAARPSV